jgi:hypothetical protein
MFNTIVGTEAVGAGAVGAEAASRYGSGSGQKKKMRLRLRNTAHGTTCKLFPLFFTLPLGMWLLRDQKSGKATT